MRFRNIKFTPEEGRGLIKKSFSEIEPNRILFAPVYLYLRSNQKFVSIKEPLDFFTEADIEKLKTYENIYVHSFEKKLVPFQRAGKDLNQYLTSFEQNRWKQVQKGPYPYEVDHFILKRLSYLWGIDLSIEPFFTAVFVESFSGALEFKILKQAQEMDVVVYEKAFLLSSWIVFMALHIGYNDYDFLNKIRNEIFEFCLKAEKNPFNNSELEELFKISKNWVGENPFQKMTFQQFEKELSRVNQKFASRLKVVKEQFSENLKLEISLFGDDGICDVG